MMRDGTQLLKFNGQLFFCWKWFSMLWWFSILTYISLSLFRLSEKRAHRSPKMYWMSVFIWFDSCSCSKFIGVKYTTLCRFYCSFFILLFRSFEKCLSSLFASLSTSSFFLFAAADNLLLRHIRFNRKGI